LARTDHSFPSYGILLNINGLSGADATNMALYTN
jgi:hypothetical protein